MTASPTPRPRRKNEPNPKPGLIGRFFYGRASVFVPTASANTNRKKRGVVNLNKVKLENRPVLVFPFYFALGEAVGPVYKTGLEYKKSLEG